MSETAPTATPETQTEELQPQAANWSETFQLIEAMGYSPNVAERAAQTAAMTGEDISAASILLHTQLAPGVSHEPTEFPMSISSPDGSNKRPLLDPAERGELYEYAAGLARQLGEQRQPGQDEAFLMRVANVVALALLVAHPFADGNGRTARTLAHLIREGYDGSEATQADMQRLGSNRRTGGPPLNSYVPTKEGVDLSSRDLLDRVAALDIPLGDQVTYQEQASRTFVNPYDDYRVLTER